MQFTIDHTCPHSDACTGVIRAIRGGIQTPVSVPAGTAGAIKAATVERMEQETDARTILGSAYHLYLRPGIEMLREVDGPHRFGTWSKPILADSGGYQVSSLATMRRVIPEGITFASHINGSKHLFTPEWVMGIRHAIEADIMAAFDGCCLGNASYAYAKQSLDTTEQWLDRCPKHLEQTSPLYGYEQALFPIVRGCVYPDLRCRAAEHVASLGVPGNAIGGLAVGEPTDKMYKMIELTNSVLSRDRPRYLVGVGTPVNILEGIARGVDIFDCIIPARNAHNDQLFIWQDVINVRSAKWRTCHKPIDPEGTASTDHRYTHACLYHLFRAREITGFTLASVHSIVFYLDLVSQAHDHIIADDYPDWMHSVLPALARRL